MTKRHSPPNKAMLTIYPNFPVTNDHKWSNHRAIFHFHLFCKNHIHKKKIQTTCSCSDSNIVTTLRKGIISHTSRKRPNTITRATTMATRDTTSELEKKRKGGFWLRKWDSVDMSTFCLAGMIHMLGACAPFVFSWNALWLTLGLYYLTGICVTLGYHRLLSHNSFKIPKWLEYFIVYCGAHSLQKDPIFWVSVHKHHHKNVDTERDPHTPSQGFWFSHMGWFLYNDYLAAKCGELRSGEYSNVPELKAQWFYRFLHETYFWHPIALAILIYLYGGFPYLAWGMGMRGVLISQATFFVNSASHIWGERSWNTPDTSTNNWWVAMLTFGEGWHNNHHAFPKSARLGLEWWQFDLAWELIKFLELVGLATDVKLPTEDDKRRKAIFLGQLQTKKPETNS